MTANDPYGSFDFIFLGAGCASLSLLMRMIDSKQFIKKTFLLIDKQPKNTNDRTWCYWEKEQGYFENIVYKTWKNLSFISDDEIIKLDIAPYSYKMVRGIDFYDYCFKKISQQKNISIVYGDVVITEGKNSYVTLEGKPLTTAKALVFNSISTTHVETSYHSLLQHFKGWFIETSADAFNNEQATLMDFSLSQHNGATFAYVLPFTASKALVEYTLFSSSLLQQDEYDKALRHYIEFNLNLKDYTITETEFGVIPMTNQLFQFYNNGMYNIGTVGGNTKPSTGYTFHFIQHQSEQIVKDILSNGKPLNQGPNKKFCFYDSTFLNVLATGKLPGKTVFTTLFKKNKAYNIFKFLDNESTVAEDISIISSLPTKQFLKAGIQELFK